MEAQLTDSTLTSATNTVASIELHKAWHILSLLLRIGRPARPSELASHCILFRAEDEYVQYLCSIRNSPIFLTSDLFVTPSLVAFVALRKFVSNLDSVEAFLPRIELGVFRQRRIWEEVARTYQRRRKRLEYEFEIVPASKKRAVLRELDENEENQIVPISTVEAPIDYTKVFFLRSEHITRGIGTDERIMNLNSDNLYRMVGRARSSFNLTARQLASGKKNIGLPSNKEICILENTREHQHAHTSECQHSFLNLERSWHIPNPMTVNNINTYMPHFEQLPQTTAVEESIEWRETMMGDVSSQKILSLNATTCMELEEQTKVPAVNVEKLSHAYQPKNIGPLADKTVDNCKDKEPLVDSLRHEGEIEHVDPALGAAKTVFLRDANRANVVKCTDMIAFMDRDEAAARVERTAILSTSEHSIHQNQPLKCSAPTKTSKVDTLNPKRQALCEMLVDDKGKFSPIGKMQCTRDKNTNSIKQKVKQNHEENMYGKKGDNVKERREKPLSTALNNQQEPKPLPSFESYTIEEEEGSGGYGTVYRARRKSDRVTFAIKCPHANANRYHVYNELKMLKRFGGKNFVIKYEGSFKSGSSECLVLEHVEHDRPEILKREIEIFQLQWYGYCMFRALAGLHKQGIVHRDVKPGNFLFSCKVNKGYLIDFNLAMDLHQKYGSSEKSKVGYDVSSNHFPLVHVKTLPLANKKFLINKPMETINKDSGKGSKLLLLPKNPKKKAVDRKIVFSGQGADGSGVTSAKDATSMRTPSGERLREPIPWQGRKEIISFLQAMQAPNNEGQSIPTSKRKRVSAPPQKADKKLLHLTPMPLHCSGIAVAGAGLIKDKGDGKQKREGPCVGTKGFRAPEVLLRSALQGPKVDVWSAGVTLLYLMTGRTPFTGEPELNIKEIAKLRGSEDLWELAKLHNRESSFPLDLHDIQFLPSVKLRDWCKQNTRRPEIFEEIPGSLFDLVDKCLTVNPRLRISAEEVLRHEFFAPCHEALRKVRLSRKEVSSDSVTTLLRKESETVKCFS